MGEQPEPRRRREKDECERDSGSVPNRTDGTVKLPRCPLTAQDGFSICIKVRSSNMSSLIPSAATMGAARSRSKPILQPRDEVGGGASTVVKQDSIGNGSCRKGVRERRLEVLQEIENNNHNNSSTAVATGGDLLKSTFAEWKRICYRGKNAELAKSHKQIAKNFTY